MRDYYRILGIRPDATQGEIKEAWNFSVKAFHPDKFAGSSQRQQTVAQERTKAINEAFEVLSDPIKRANYDREYAENMRPVPPLRRRLRSPPSSPPPRPASPPPRPTTASPPPGFSSSFAAPLAGYGRFATFPKATQRKLIERQSGVIKIQVRVPLKRWVGSNYVWLIICGTYFFAIWRSNVFNNTARVTSGPEDPLPYALAAACAGFFIGAMTCKLSKLNRQGCCRFLRCIVRINLALLLGKRSAPPLETILAGGISQFCGNCYA